MAARITRAKKKIAAARIAYRVPAARRTARPARRRAHRGAPALHHRAHRPRRRQPGPRRPGRARHRPGPHAAHPDARRAGGGRPARAHPADRRPPGHPGRRRTATCCCSRTRTGRQWDRAAIAEGTALVRRALRGGRPGRFALQAAIAAAARRGPQLRADRLAADRGALRPAAAGLAFARGGAQPRRRGGHGAGPGGGAGPDRGTGGGRAAGRLPLPARHQGGPAAPPRPVRRRRHRPTGTPWR